jgi:hypothetical protein
MPTTSCKEPTKESQDTKPSVVKWGCEGPLLICLVLPPAMKARALVGAGCAQLRAGQARLRGGAHGSGEGTSACRDRTRTSAGGAHPCGEGTHGCLGARTPVRRVAHTSAGWARMVFFFFWVFRTSLPNQVRHTCLKCQLQICKYE